MCLAPPPAWLKGEEEVACEKTLGAESHAWSGPAHLAFLAAKWCMLTAVVCSVRDKMRLVLSRGCYGFCMTGIFFFKTGII